MNFSKFFIILFLLFLIGTQGIFAQTVPTASIQKAALHPFTETVSRINKELSEQRYSAAIFSLSALMSAVREKQRESIRSFFPTEFETYKAKRSGSHSTSDFGSTDYGVLFNQYYENASHHSIEVNVIFSDPSIREYANLVKNPDLLKGLETTTLVKLNMHLSAIQKVADDGGYVEQNIVLNDDLLINVVANGNRDPKILERFSNAVKLKELEKYLNF